jgi:hypothetical protein
VKKEGRGHSGAKTTMLSDIPLEHEDRQRTQAWMMNARNQTNRDRTDQFRHLSLLDFGSIIMCMIPVSNSEFQYLTTVQGVGSIVS